jgi:hypothetical protein
VKKLISNLSSTGREPLRSVYPVIIKIIKADAASIAVRILKILSAEVFWFNSIYPEIYRIIQKNGSFYSEPSEASISARR